MEIVRKILVREICPNVSGWYDTNKGNIYWNNSKEVWSCRSDRVSEEYPEWWLEESTELSNWNKPQVSGCAKRCKAPLEDYQSCMDDYAKKKCFDCEHYR